MRQLIWALALMGLLLAAQPEDTGVPDAVLDARYAQLQCRAEAVYGLLDNAEYFDPQANMNQYREEVETQMQLMLQYANSGDYNSFNKGFSGAKNSFTDGINGARNAHKNALNAAGSQGSGGSGSGQGGSGASGEGQTQEQVKQQMLEKYGEVKEQYQACNHEALQNRVHAEVGVVDEWQAKGKNASVKMKQNGYDTSELDAIVEESESIKDEVEAAADEGLTDEELDEKRREGWEKESYLWTEFHAVKFNLVLDRIAEKTTGNEAEIAQIRTTLEQALQIGDDKQYDTEETVQAREMIETAAGQIEALVEEESAD